MSNRLIVFLVAAGGLLWVCSERARCEEDPFAANVRPTDPLSPEEEQRSFRVPPGFQVELFASEPDIQKPMNMAFDGRGRLWLTDTTEYPFALPPGRKGQDTLKVLEDTDGDGRADKITTFADGLNIPIGVYPYKDGAIVFSIPHIWHLRDTDGNGIADDRKRLYGPMGVDRDTHGLNNGFRRGFDGWLYACHGFNNDTKVAGTDGHEIHMNSGNTYRMRLDGSRIEQFTWGQVNPFGMTIDPFGNHFTADCHTMPIYPLLHGGYYPSFGKPHDGLGFVPAIMRHGHGSTAIAGIVYYAADEFPEPYRGNIFTGNVMTSRINRDSLEYRGSTIVAREEPDFVETSDPWFRPVDLQLGPDGAIYVADFYNRIIGHYEVDLHHPGRDRHRGRIWRIGYVGESGKPAPASEPMDFATAPVDELVEALEHPNFTRRSLATTELVDRVGVGAVVPVTCTLLQSKSEDARCHALWILHRLNSLSPVLLRAAATDPARPRLRVHAMKVLAEMPRWPAEVKSVALGGLRDADGFVRRAAADALGQHPDPGHLDPLLDALAAAPAEDALLVHGIRIALRNTLQAKGSFEALASRKLSDEKARAIAGAAVAVKSTEAGAFLLKHVQTRDEAPERVRQFLEHAARNLPATSISALAAFARQKYADDVDFQQGLLESIRQGLQQRGVRPDADFRAWAEELAGKLLDQTTGGDESWRNLPLNGSENPWVVQPRVSADGDKSSPYLTSLPRGETLTGVLRSPEFEIPATLSFFAAGHNGEPGQPDARKNVIRLRDAQTGAILAESLPPRNDLAQRFEWDLTKYAGGRGSIEIVDADDAEAFAWLAVGRFEPAVVRVPEISPAASTNRQLAAARIVGELNLVRLRSRIAERLDAGGLEPPVAEAFGAALGTLAGDCRLQALACAAGDTALAESLRDRAGRVVATGDEAAIPIALADVTKAAPARLQQKIAEKLVADRRGVEALLELVSSGAASPQLLVRPSIQSRLEAFNDPGLLKQISELTADLPSQSEELQRLIESRLAEQKAGSHSANAGAAVFRKHCAACHKIGAEGNMVGPQLDGIGNRGLERIVEDVLNPGRNVDVAFRTTTLVLSDGRTLSGLVRREEGNVLVLVDNQGKEFTVPMNEIEKRVPSRLSLMPANVAEIIPAAEFHDLVAYLLAQRAEPPAPKAAEEQRAEAGGQGR